MPPISQQCNVFAVHFFFLYIIFRTKTLSFVIVRISKGTVHATNLFAYSNNRSWLGINWVQGWCWNTKLVRICQSGEVCIVSGAICFLPPRLPNSIKKCCHVPKFTYHIECTCNLLYASLTCIHHYSIYIYIYQPHFHLRMYETQTCALLHI